MAELSKKTIVVFPNGEKKEKAFITAFKTKTANGTENYIVFDSGKVQEQKYKIFEVSRKKEKEMKFGNIVDLEEWKRAKGCLVASLHDETDNIEYCNVDSEISVASDEYGNSLALKPENEAKLEENYNNAIEKMKHPEAQITAESKESIVAEPSVVENTSTDEAVIKNMAPITVEEPKSFTPDNMIYEETIPEALKTANAPVENSNVEANNIMAAITPEPVNLIQEMPPIVDAVPTNIPEPQIVANQPIEGIGKENTVEVNKTVTSDTQENKSAVETSYMESFSKAIEQMKQAAEKMKSACEMMNSATNQVNAAIDVVIKTGENVQEISHANFQEIKGLNEFSRQAFDKAQEAQRMMEQQNNLRQFPNQNLTQPIEEENTHKIAA